jgi:hypothetical protein
MTPKRRVLLWIGLALFGTSFLLPALWPDKPPHEMFSIRESLPGWAACAFGWVCLADGHDVVGVLVGATCLTNLAMLVAVVAARFRGPNRFAARLLWGCAAYDLAWLFVVPVRQLGPGYCAWIASFAVAGAALRPVAAAPSPRLGGA